MTYTRRGIIIFTTKVIVFFLLAWIYKVLLVIFFTDYIKARIGVYAFNPYGRGLDGFIMGFAAVLTLFCIIIFKIINRLSNLKDEDRLLQIGKEAYDRKTMVFLVSVAFFILTVVSTILIHEFIRGMD